MSWHLPLWPLPAVSLLATVAYFSLRSRNKPIAGRRPFHTIFSDNWPSLVIGLTAVGIAVLVLSRVGIDNGHGSVFTTLFVNDYFNHMAVTAEISRNVPPQNIYFHGQPAHYYWFLHVIPGSFHRLAGHASNVRSLLLIINAANIVMLFLTIGRLLQLTGVGRRAIAWSLALFVFAYSYIDLFLAGREFGQWIDITGIVPALAGPWAKLESISGLSHSYMRDFFVEPHSVAAILFTALAIQVQGFRATSLPRFVKGLVLGLLVLGAFGCDSFLGVILAVWVGADTAISFYEAPSRDRPGFISLIAGIAVVAVVGLAYIFGFQMTEGQGGLLSLSPMTGVIATLPLYLALDYGAIFVLGIAGWWLVRRRRIQFTLRHLWLLAAIALIFGLFVRHAVEYDIVLRKSGKPLQLMLIVGCGIFFQYYRPGRRWQRALTVIVILLALPTLALDIQAFGGFFGSRGLENRISRENIEAMLWIRDNTPDSAVVQGKPAYQGEYLYEFNPVPPIAERPVAVGTYMMSSLWGVGGARAIHRIREVETMFETRNLDSLLTVIKKHNISYIYVGDQECRAFDLSPYLRGDIDGLFDTVYNRGGIRILEVRQPEQTAVSTIPHSGNRPGGPS